AGAGEELTLTEGDGETTAFTVVVWVGDVELDDPELPASACGPTGSVAVAVAVVVGSVAVGSVGATPCALRDAPWTADVTVRTGADVPVAGADVSARET